MTLFMTIIHDVFIVVAFYCYLLLFDAVVGAA